MENKKDIPIYLWKEGTNFHAASFFGAHKEGTEVVFRVYAPNAKYVSVVGDFNFWDKSAHPMEEIDKSGVFEKKIPYVNNFDI